ncbi:MAG: hypothetical protein R3B82_24690 [Sandaracinaceae bacterium]
MRFFLDQPTSMGEEAMRKRARDGRCRAARSGVRRGRDRGGDSALFAPTVRNRGEQAAMRTLRLPATGLKPLLPNDGFVWTRGGSRRGRPDRLTMAPALPEVTVEVAGSTAPTPAAFDRLTAPRVAGKATRVPPGWVAGPMIHPVDNVPELTLCHASEEPERAARRDLHHAVRPGRHRVRAAPRRAGDGGRQRAASM